MAAIAWTGPAFEALRQIYQCMVWDSRQYADSMVRRIRMAVSRSEHVPEGDHAAMHQSDAVVATQRQDSD